MSTFPCFIQVESSRRLQDIFIKVVFSAVKPGGTSFPTPQVINLKFIDPLLFHDRHNVIIFSRWNDCTDILWQYHFKSSQMSTFPWHFIQVVEGYNQEVNVHLTGHYFTQYLLTGELQHIKQYITENASCRSMPFENPTKGWNIHWISQSFGTRTGF